MVDEFGIDVARQESGTKTRLFSVENIFELAHYRANRRKEKPAPKKQVVATMYAPNSGVGKTTLASNFGTIFSLRGFKTLVIDLDFQANLTLSFGYDPALTAAEAIEAGISPSEIVEHHFGNLTPNYPLGRVTLQEAIKKPFGEYGPHIVPADLNLDRLDAMLMHEMFVNRNADLTLARLIKEGLSKKDQYFDISEYDIILFDAAPANNRITYGALLASDHVISPVSMEKFSPKGMFYLSSILAEMQDQFERSPDLIIVGNFFDPNRVRAMGQLMAITQASYKDAWLDSSIRRSEDFSKALIGESELPVVLSKPGSQTATELCASANELLERMEISKSCPNRT
ncbi:ParA family protein [Paraburkholderia rhizosphaerae]|nr:ParA family protein [Paraburkholderia rhizosphaerae]